MYLDRYVYVINEGLLDYEFNSIGPKGSIQKLVRFTQVSMNIFNLSFGDLTGNSRKLDDLVISNNGDGQKVLATVAVVVRDFLLNHPNMFVIIQGSTRSRNRLYRMGITRNLKEISGEYEIFGFRNNKWEAFEKNNEYDNFLIRRR